MDALSRREGERVTLTSLATDGAGYAHGSGGGRSVLLLRETPETGGTVVSRQLTGSQDIYALRFLALAEGGGGGYSYSLDGGNGWRPLPAGEYVWLDAPAREVMVRAQMNAGATLAAWHLEGVTAGGTSARVQLVEPPLHVVAADYSEYYENPELRMHQLSWYDPMPADDTHPNATVYEIERDGEPLATVEIPSYIDQDFAPGARYRVRSVRTYARPQNNRGPHHLVRESGWADAVPARLKPMQRIMGVQPSLGEMNESEYLDWLYGGNYTLSAEPNPPTGGRELDQKLLGSQKLCALGFEPINFNTGNFFLMAQDVFVADAGGAALNVIRTYNTQSDELNGPFGSRWNTDYAEHLVLYGDGSLGWRRGDGGLNIFTRRPDGSYAGNDDDGLVLRIGEDQNEYQLVETDGTIRAFTGAGLLKRIEQANGQAIEIERDGRGLITGVVAPSGARLEVEMDEKGHIVAVTTPGGATTRYAYEGNDLVRVTDANGGSTRYLYDDQGRMTEWFDAGGARQAYNVYDEKNRVVYQEDALGGKYTLEYFGDHTVTTDAEGNVNIIYFDAQKRTVREVDAEGAVTAYTHDSYGYLASETDGRGRTITYTDDARGNLLSAATPDGATVRYEYDEDNNLIRMTDALGNATVYEYDEFRNMTSQTNADDGVIRYAYDEWGHLITVTDALGAQTHYGYNERGWLIQETGALGHVTAHAYDADGRRVSTTDALGNVTRYEYDAKGNMTALTFADGTQILYAYDAMGRPVTMTDPLGNVTKYKYDPLGNVLEITLPDGTKQTAKYTPSYLLAESANALGAVTAFQYDGVGNLVSETDALGNVTAWAYDAAGWPVAMTLPTGATETYTYDPATGLLIESTDVRGLTNRFDYDAAGNLLTRTLPGGAELHNAYDAMNRLVRQTNPLGGVTEIAYDLNGNIASVTDPLGAVTRFEYDALGRLVKAIDALGAESAFQYDEVGRLAVATDALGASTSYAYDAVGDLVSVTDALGAVSAFAYDEAGNLVEFTDAMGEKTAYHYDKLGRLIQVTDALGNKTAYRYDKRGQVAQVVDALGRRTNYGYDALGNLTAETDALGNRTRYTYTSLGQLESVKKADGTALNYDYDAAGRLLAQHLGGGQSIAIEYNEVGEIATITTPEGANLYQYDAHGQLLSVEYANGDVVSYTYDPVGNKTGTTYPDGRVVTYEYDSVHRLTAVVGLDGEKTTYAYDAAGRRIQTSTDDFTTAYAYNSAGDLLQLATSGITDIAFAYAHDLTGRITEETRTEAGVAIVSSYTYDPLGQLTGFAKTDGYAETYTYDAVGNMKQKMITPAHDEGIAATPITLSMTYNKGNQLTQMRGPEGRINYTYDRRGNLTRKQMGRQRDTYAYDAMDRLVGYKGYDGFEQQYALDAFGLRTGIMQKGNPDRLTMEEMLQGRAMDVAEPSVDEWVKTSYIYDITLPHGQMLTETVDNGTTAYTYGQERIAAHNGTLKTQYVYDGRGSVAQTLAMMPSASNPMVSSFAYTPFGEMLSGKQTGFGFNAEWYDAATGMQNLRARQYEPGMGRFSQKDVLRGDIFQPLSLNRYAYVLNDPIGYIDPSGMASKMNLHRGDVGGIGAGGLKGGGGGGKGSAIANVKSATSVKTSTTCVNLGRAATRLRPDLSATGPHSTFRIDPITGKITKYTTWNPNPQNPRGFDWGIKYHETGKPHFNKVTGSYFYTPHVHDKGVPGEVRNPQTVETPER